jgi:hypothetical protein
VRGAGNDYRAGPVDVAQDEDADVEVGCPTLRCRAPTSTPSVSTVVDLKREGW